eukprot:gene1430-2047_t
MCQAVDKWKDSSTVPELAGRAKSFGLTPRKNQIKATLFPAFSDGFLTSWQFPIWEVDFGAKAPYWFYGSVHPATAWTAFLIPASLARPIDALDNTKISSDNATAKQGDASDTGEQEGSTGALAADMNDQNTSMENTANRRDCSPRGVGWQGRGVYVNLS